LAGHPSLAFGELRMASQASWPHAKNVHRNCEAAKVDRARHFFPACLERSSILVEEWPEIDITV